MKSLTTFGTLIALLVAASVAGAAPHGGMGGQPFTLDCGSDAVLAGVSARTGALVDSVEAVCVKVKSDGSWSGGYVNKGRAGGSGGAPISLYCDDGWAVMGLHGRSGNAVDKLGVRCGKLGAQGGVIKVVQGNTMRGPSGGNGGAAFDDTCPGGQVGRGLRGRAGNVIDQIELVCGNPTAPAPPPAMAQKGPATSQLSSALSDPGKIEIQVPCGSAPIALNIRPANMATVQIPTLTIDWAPQVDVPLCVTPGWSKYEWRSTVSSGLFTIRDADKPRAVLSFTPRPGSGGSGFTLQDGKWTGLAGLTIYVDGPVALPGADRRYAVAIFNVVARNMPTPPSIAKVWIEDYRPNRPGPLENFGIVDPALIGSPDPIDGEFYVEGTGLAPKDRKVKIGGKEATVLSHTTTGGVERLKAKVRDFTPGRVVIEGAGGSAQSPQSLKRLGWWVMANDVLPSFLQGLSVVVGSPRGQGSVTLLGRTTPMAIQGYRQSGVSLDVIDLRSQAPTIATRQTGDDIEYTITIPFETDGRELDGTFLSTVEYWRCGSFEVPKSRCGGADIGCFLGAIGNSLRSSASCMNPGNWSTASAPGPSVALSGDLTSPKATLVSKVGIQNGKLANRGTTVSFSAGISLSAAGVSLPIEAIQTQIMNEVNTKLTNAVNPNDLGTQLATRLQQVVSTLTGQASLLDHVVVIQDGSVFFGFHRP